MSSTTEASLPIVNNGTDGKFDFKVNYIKLDGA